jgi:hypothetical protein
VIVSKLLYNVVETKHASGADIEGVEWGCSNSLFGQQYYIFVGSLARKLEIIMYDCLRRNPYLEILHPDLCVHSVQSIGTVMFRTR